jgi:2-polyprenyl-3-methyl-5-hydroxy-6-metoxy-1,4-benzoquinol methylase
MGMNDPRKDVYEDLHSGQMKAEEQTGRFSADRILDIVGEYLQPASVLDVGCGLGTWIAALQGRGVKDVLGIDGPWLNPKDAVCDPSVLQVTDLEAGFDLGRRFDLVICLEVAEHLSPQAAERFVESLARHSSAILFSAAIPFQGGHYHVNERFLSYWTTLFAKHAFLPLDIVRGRIWHDQQVHWWLRQNIVLFTHKELTEANEKLKRVAEHQTPISVVHPDVYMERMRGLLAQLEQFKKVEAALRQGGTFKSTVTPQGLTITKVGSDPSPKRRKF